MKAVRYHQHGGPEVLVVDEAPAPEPKRGEVRIRVKATALNHLDIWVRTGLPGIHLPHIPGCDAAGVVEAIGPETVTSLKPGDAVLANPGISCGTCEFCAEGSGSLCLSYNILGEHSDGASAEFACLPARNLHPIPAGASFEEAAAFGLTFLTAWRMVMTRARLRPGETLLIHGAGAGVSVACLQIAKLAGARVFVTAGSDGKLAQAKALGADLGINYKTQDFEKVVKEATGKRGVDAIVDHVGADTWVKDLKSLKRGGRLVTCGATSGFNPQEDLRHIFFRQLEILGSTMGSYKEFADVYRLYATGRVKPVVARVFPMAQVADAHRLMESRDFFGKIVVTIPS